VLVTIVPIAAGLCRIDPVPAEIRCGRDGGVGGRAEDGAEGDATNHRSIVRSLVPLPIGLYDDDFLVVPMLIVPVLVFVLVGNDDQPSVSLADLVLLASPPLAMSADAGVSGAAKPRPRPITTAPGKAFRRRDTTPFADSTF
jgi:hypothetical protein